MLQELYTITPGTNRLASVTTATSTGSVTRTLTLNGRGDISGELRDALPVTTSYDAYGRLTSYTRSGTPNAAMLYSGTDERVQVTSGTTPRRFVYDESGRLVGEYGATSVVFAEHVWLMPDTDEGGWEPLALLGATTLSYVHGDHLGVPVVITNTAGTSINDMQADPFGRRYRTASGSQPRTSLALPGQIIDIADRHYNVYRDYDPTLGRYLQADPIGLEGGDNVYGYVGGNPVNDVDQNGLKITVITSDRRIAKILMESYYRLNQSKSAREITGPLERSRINYQIRPIYHDAFYCELAGGICKRGHTVYVDPCNRIMLPTTSGLQPTPLEIVLGHELGHAAGTRDTGWSRMENVIRNENPIRRDLGFPIRTAYTVPKIIWISGCGCQDD